MFPAIAGVAAGAPVGSSRFRRLNLAQSPLEVSSLAVISDQCQRTQIALCRFFAGSIAAQQIGTRSVQQTVIVEIAVAVSASVISKAGCRPSAIDPGARELGDAGGRPLIQIGRKCFLRTLFGQIEIPKKSDPCGHDPAAVRAANFFRPNVDSRSTRSINRWRHNNEVHVAHLC
jgi:hypothetical protein